MIRYKTVEKESSAEQIIEKSRFIAHVKPVDSKEEADLFIAGIKKAHKAATHNVPVMVIGDRFQIQWASDDGEPQGTAGAPIVQMLVKEGITNVVVVVTRYFGGIKLGTGGLVRAYTGSAKDGIYAAQLCHVEEMYVINFKVNYTYLSKIQSMAPEKKYQIVDIAYEEMVILKVVADLEKGDEVESFFINLTAGNIEILGKTTELSKNRL